MVNITKRRTYTFLPIPLSAQSCPDGRVYEPARSACQDSCAAPEFEDQCPVTPRENCFCPNGQLDRNGECVETDDCGCRLPDGSFVDVSVGLLCNCGLVVLRQIMLSTINFDRKVVTSNQGARKLCMFVPAIRSHFPLLGVRWYGFQSRICEKGAKGLSIL